MITHKIRIYPNKTMRTFLEEQFEFARRDYNRQLEIYARGVKSGAITPANWSESLTRVRSYCARHPSFYHGNNYHFPDIIGWNSKRLSMVASRMVKGKANAKFKSYGVGKKAFKISSAKLDEHRFHIRSNQKLVLEGFGTIRMAENPRFASEPISVEILSHNNRYYACFLFPETPLAYPLSGKSIGIDVGISCFAVGVDETSRVWRYDLKTGKKDKVAKRINHYTRYISYKVQKHGSHPTSNRYARTLARLRNAYFRQGNVKNNFIEQTCHIIAKRYDFIGIESLSMVSMLKRRSVAKWYIHKPYAAFLHRLRAKALQAGKVVQEVPQNFPSSQICHCCGNRSFITKNLSIRSWTCPHCGAELNRDENAAHNILQRAKLDAPVPF